jgi:hypothetical protein
MKATKRKALEAKGWRVGSTAEFLDLNPVEEEMVELRLLLAGEVRAERARQELTQQALAYRLGSSQPRVAAMESGAEGTSFDLLLRALLTLRPAVAKQLRGALRGRKTNAAGPAKKNRAARAA